MWVNTSLKLLKFKEQPKGELIPYFYEQTCTKMEPSHLHMKEEKKRHLAFLSKIFYVKISELFWVQNKEEEFCICWVHTVRQWRHWRVALSTWSFVFSDRPLFSYLSQNRDDRSVGRGNPNMGILKTTFCLESPSSLWFSGGETAACLQIPQNIEDLGFDSPHPLAWILLCLTLILSSLLLFTVPFRKVRLSVLGFYCFSWSRMHSARYFTQPSSEDLYFRLPLV